jgi:hypothetical protein
MLKAWCRTFLPSWACCQLYQKCTLFEFAQYDQLFTSMAHAVQSQGSIPFTYCIHHQFCWLKQFDHVSVRGAGGSRDTSLAIWEGKSKIASHITSHPSAIMNQLNCTPFLWFTYMMNPCLITEIHPICINSIHVYQLSILLGEQFDHASVWGTRGSRDSCIAIYSSEENKSQKTSYIASYTSAMVH